MIKGIKFILALKSYSKAIQKASRNDVLFTNKALCFLKLKRFDEACSEARESIAIAPNRCEFSQKINLLRIEFSVKGHYLLGQSLIHLERYDDAVIALQTVSFQGDRLKYLNAILLGAKVRS